MFRSPFDIIRVPVKKIFEEELEVNLSKLVCDVCGEEDELSNEDDLDLHIRKEHKEELLNVMKEGNTIICSACFRVFKEENALLEHIRKEHLYTASISTHIEHEIYICNDCERIFYNKDLLIAHNAHCHIQKRIEKQKIFIDCPVCKKKIRGTNIWFHFCGHKLLKSTICPICLKNVHRRNRIVDHVIKRHSPFYQCGICKFNTGVKSYFTEHIEIHKKTEDRQLNTIKNVADYFYPNKRSPVWTRRYINPFKGVVVPMKVNICVLCQAIFEQSDLSGMLTHLQRDHGFAKPKPEKIYSCVCGDSFNGKIFLTAHINKSQGGHKEADSTTVNYEGDIQADDDNNEIITVEQMLEPINNDDVCYEIEIVDGINEPVAGTSSYIDSELTEELDVEMNLESDFIEMNTAPETAPDLAQLDSEVNLVEIDSESDLIHLNTESNF